jgi:hypothetical protein
MRAFYLAYANFGQELSQPVTESVGGRQILKQSVSETARQRTRGSSSILSQAVTESVDKATHVPVMVKDALAGKHGEYEIVLTNPPFGKKSSVTIVNGKGN